MTLKYCFVAGVLAALFLLAGHAQPQIAEKFDFGSGPVQTGFSKVTAASVYSDATGFGFMSGGDVSDVDRKVPDALRGDFVTSEKPFVFAVKVPEGNYNVSILLGDQTEASETTVKAESRQLELWKVETAPGKFETRTFTVNVRQPKYSGGQVAINSREQGPPIASRWDDMLTLEFNGKRPAVAALEIAPAPDATTVFLCGDSTVTDQANEPWAGWGQMLPSFFAPGVAVANHAESGLALSSFRQQKRLDKVLASLKKGDYVFVQFGHNDQKDKSPGAGPFTTYAANLKKYVEQIRAKGGLPVLVTPMERRRWVNGQPQETLTDYAKAVRQVGAAAKVPVIDLHAMSLQLYAALGEKGSEKAFVFYPANTFPGQAKALKDNTHHNSYGGYELARCIVEGIKKEVPALAEHLRKEVKPFDPSQPDPAENFDLPASPFAIVEKPAGS